MAYNIEEFNINNRVAYLSGVDISLDANKDTQQPASCKSVSDKFNDLDLDIQSNMTKINFSHGFIDTSINPIDINNAIETTYWNYSVVPCTEGDKFLITAIGQRPNAHLWTFVMANGAILSQSDSSNDILNMGVIVAPPLSEYLILNDKSLTPICYKGYPLRFFVDDNNNQITNIDNKLNELVNNDIQIQAIPIEYIKNAFIDVSSDVVDINSPISAVNSWNYAIVSCTEGDKFFISGQGQLYAAAIWTFIDVNGNKILQANVNICEATILVAPSNSSFFILNNIATNKDISYINVPLYAYTKIIEKRYKSYEDGYITFTVGVNQNIPDLSNHNNETLDNEASIEQVICSLKLPTSYSNIGIPSRLIMMCHGAGRGLNGTNGWMNSADYNNIVNLFNAGGYVVFDCNGYANTSNGVNFWGAPRGVECYIKAYQYIVDNYNVEHQFSIYGFSMGGLTALQIANGLFPNVKCIALGSPVTNLEYHFIGHEDFYASGYGFISSDTYDIEKTKGADPLKGIITIDNISYCMRNYPPMKIWFGNNDVSVPYQYAKQLVEAIRNSNGIAYFREINGAGHEICYGANIAINLEYLYWIDRFNDRL